MSRRSYNQRNSSRGNSRGFNRSKTFARRGEAQGRGFHRQEKNDREFDLNSEIPKDIKTVDIFDVFTIEKMLMSSSGDSSILTEDELIAEFRERDILDPYFMCIMCSQCPCNNIEPHFKKFTQITLNKYPEKFYKQNCSCGTHIAECVPDNPNCLHSDFDACRECIMFTSCFHSHNKHRDLIFDIAKNYRGCENYIMAFVKFLFYEYLDLKSTYYAMRPGNEHIYDFAAPWNIEKTVYGDDLKKGTISLLHFTTGRVTKWLLNHGADPDHVGLQLKKLDYNSDNRVAHYQTPIFSAGNNLEVPFTSMPVRSTKTVEILIKSKANIDFQNNFGKTPLFYANEKIVALLHENNANLHIKDNNGQTAYDLAIKGKKDMLKDYIFLESQKS